jgi:hypothetical protein
MNVTVVHAMPGRVRLRVACMKQNVELARELQSELANGVAFHQIEANPATGSLLLTFDPAHQQTVWGRLQSTFPDLQASELHNTWIPDSDGSARAMASDVTRLFERLNKRVERRTGFADLRLLVPLVLVMWAAGSLILAALRRGRIPVPDWYDLIWFAFNLFVILNLPLQSRDEESGDSSR